MLAQIQATVRSSNCVTLAESVRDIQLVRYSTIMNGGTAVSILSPIGKGFSLRMNGK
jgi:hypothetical protein